MHFRTRTWFIISLLCFFAAAVFWQLAERKAAQDRARKEGVVSPTTGAPTPANLPTAPASTATSAAAKTNASNVATNARFRFRLANSQKTIDELSRSEQAVLLRNALIDSSVPVNLSIPPHLRAQGDPGSYIVQSRGPLTDAFRARLETAGAEIISYVPNNAYLVRASEAAVKQLEAAGGVQSVLPWEPYFKLEPALLDLAVNQKPAPAGTRLNVLLFPGTREATLAALERMDIAVVSEERSPFGPQLVVRLPVDGLVALASLPAVHSAERNFPRRPANDIARGRVLVATNTAGAPNYQGLTGDGVLVSVNDTGVDALHPDLTGRVSADSPLTLTDLDGHGTHVAGTIASSGENGPNGANVPGSATNANFRGMAPKAKIFAQPIDPAFGRYQSDATLQENAAATNALISNNSWGYGIEDYTLASAIWDAAARDALPGMTGPQPLAAVFAAGNNGIPESTLFGFSAGTILSPATSKNVITVGAIENLRNITNEVVFQSVTNQPWLGITDSSNQVANFSSRGNVGIGSEGGFGRFKPDIVAPGTFVASTKATGLADPSGSTNLVVNIQQDERVRRGQTNYYAVGTDFQTVRVVFQVLSNYYSPKPFPSLLVYARQDAVPVPPGDFAGINQADVPATVGTMVFAIVNTNAFDVRFDLRTIVVNTNDTGDYFDVLRQVNAPLGPNYRFESGTSMAAPVVSGVLALMVEQLRKSPSNLTNPSPALLKALLINGARTANNEYDFAVNEYENLQGWGLANLTNSIPENIKAGTSNGAASGSMVFYEQSPNQALITGQSATRRVNVTGDSVGLPLRFSLVWTDPPGNPNVALKLVNDLDLIVTNETTGEIYYGNNFIGNGVFSSPVGSSSDGPRDIVNNVENVFIAAPNEGFYSVSVVARRVTVNAVTTQTRGIAQDYALVISSENAASGALSVTPVAQPGFNVFPTVNIVTNGIPLLNQRVGANLPFLTTTNGITNQWRFFVVTNQLPTSDPASTNGGVASNIAFVVFFPPNLSQERTNTADIDLFVSTNPAITNLDQTVIATSRRSVGRAGTESVVIANAVPGTLYYAGVKSEDQQAANFGFFSVSSATPFSSEDTNGTVTARGYPLSVDIPDGLPDRPEAALMFAFVTQDITIESVVVTNTITHTNGGDLFGLLEHEGKKSVLNAHRPIFGTVEYIWDDTDSGEIPDSLPTDAPGSLRNFVGDQGVGVWQLTMIENAFVDSGRIENFSIKIEPRKDDLTNDTGIVATILPQRWKFTVVEVPADATNLAVCVVPDTGPVEVYVRRAAFPDRGVFDTFGTVAPPGDCVNLGLRDSPPLSQGRYFIGVYNPNATPVTVNIRVRIDRNLNERSNFSYRSAGSVNILDDAVTNSIIHVNRNQALADVSVGVRIDHPRVADLVLHLVSPSGTRIMLAENRGRNTADYGFGTLQTNVAPAGSSGGPTASTNVIGPVLPEGTVEVNYDFQNVPDRMTIYYDNRLIFDSGLISGVGTFSVDYGPGLATNVVIIMNEGGNFNTGTFWDYTATIYSGYRYAVFTENTQYAKLPIKFAVPPFTNFNYFGTNYVTSPSGLGPIVMSDGFDTGAGACGLFAPAFFSGWELVSGEVDIIYNGCGMLGPSHSGANGLDLNGCGPGVMRTNFNTIPGVQYNLSFAYSRNPNTVSTPSTEPARQARISLTGNPDWNLSVALPNSFQNIMWQTTSTVFTATGPVTTLELTSLEAGCAGVFFDTFLVQQIGAVEPRVETGIYFLPEEPLTPLRGENAFGDWQLEIWDNRIGGAVTNGTLLAWKLNLTFVNTNPVAIPLTNAMPFCGVLAENETAFFRVDVPITAAAATNLIAGSADLDFSYGSVGLPVGTQPPDTFFLTDIPAGSAIIGINGWNSFDGAGALFDGSTVPVIQPGKRYYLAVRNKARGTNSFCVEVGFDQVTPNLVGIIPLTNTCTTFTNNTPVLNGVDYFSFDVSSNAIGVEFEIRGMSSDVDLVVRRGVPLPDGTSYQAGSFNTGTANEFIQRADFFGTDLPGRWYIGVVHQTSAASVSYTVCRREIPGPVQPLPTNSCTLASIGGSTAQYYKVQVSTNAYLADFVLTNISGGNVDLYLSTNTMTPLLRAPTNALYASTLPGTDFIRVSGYATNNPLVPGSWFVAVVNPTTNLVTYQVCVTEYVSNAPPYIALTNGVRFVDSVNPPNDPMGLFKFDVATNAIQVVFETFGANGDVDLYVRYGLPVPEPGPPSRFTYASTKLGTTNEYIGLYQGGPPPLPGTYYISVLPKAGAVTYSVRVTQILATDVQDLANGASVCRTIAAINTNRLYTGVHFFSVDVPRGALKATIETFNHTGNVDLYVQPALPLTNFTSYPLGQPSLPYRSENGGLIGEFLCLQTNSSPAPLSQGRWYVTVVNHGLTPAGYCIRSSVLSPTNVVQLDDGVAQCVFSGPADGSPLGGNNYYVFTVASNAVQTTFEAYNVIADPGGLADVDLYLTRDISCLVTNVALNATYASTNRGSLPEMICLATNSTPQPLAPGDWYVIVANRSSTNSVGYCVRATSLIDTNIIVATNGLSVCRTVGVGNGAMNTGIDYYLVSVTNGPVLATFQTFNADGNVDLYVMKDLCLPNFAMFDASSTNYPYASTNLGTVQECITIGTNTAPVVLTNGSWYVAVVNRDATNVNYCFLAEQFTSNPITPLANNVPICPDTVSGSPGAGPAGVRYYSFTVSTNALQVTFETYNQSGNVDLYVQNGFCFANRDTFSLGSLNAPYASTNALNASESICVSGGSSPVALQPGEWILAVVNREVGNSTFCVRARELRNTDIIGLTNGVGYAPPSGATNGEVQYYHYNVSPDAILVNFEVLQPTGNVDLFLDPDFCPQGLANFTYSSRNLGTNSELIALAPGSSPVPLTPGEWLIAVTNLAGGPANYTVRVTEVLPSQIVRLTNALAYASTVEGVGSAAGFAVDYYVFNVSATSVRAQFEVLNPNGDVTLVARKGLPLPNLSNTPLVSGNGGNSDELIVLFDSSTPVALTPGDWYLAVINNGSTPVNYQVVATEYSTRGTNVVINRISVDTNGICLTWTNTLPGVNYYVLGVTNLGDNWVAVSTTIKAAGNAIIWCTPLPSPYHFFRISEGLSPLSVVTPISFANMTASPSGFSAQWQAPPGRQFQVEWTDTLSPANWQNLGAPITSLTGNYSFTDNGTGTGGLPLPANRYYRITLLP